MTSDERRDTRYGPLPEELAIIAPREVPSLAVWPEGELILPGIESDAAGPFTYDLAPWERGICEALTDPFVREVTVSAPLQMGKTMIGMLWMCHVVRYEPANMIVVMADENTLKRRMKRLRATFKANPFLLEALGGSIDSFHIGEPTELGDMLLYLAWSNSDATMASDPIPYVIADEVALWSPFAGRSGIHGLNHLRGRTLAFPNRGKLLVISSPRNTGDDFDLQYQAGDRCEYWVPCPRCRYWHVMQWWDKDNPDVYVTLDRDERGDWLSLEAYESGRHVRYRCPSCTAVWSDYARAAALADGQWLPAGVTMGPGGAVEGEMPVTPYKSFHVDGLMGHPRLRSLRSMAVAFVRAQLALKGGRAEPLRHFQNNHRGLPWKETRAETDEGMLRRHIDAGYRSGEVPWGVQAITIAVDVHDNWFRVKVDGWGYLYECWPIEIMRIETSDTRESEAYEPLRPLLVRSWQTADGQWLLPSAVTIDSGYRPSPVKNFCLDNRSVVWRGNLIPVRGSPRQMRRMYTKVPQDAVLMLYELNTVEYKDQLWRMLFEAQHPGPGYMHLPSDVGGDVFGELCSEHKLIVDGRPTWVPKKDGRDNHAWDCSVYSLFAATLIGVGMMKPLAERPAKQAHQAPAPAPASAGPKHTRKIRTHYD